MPSQYNNLSIDDEHIKLILEAANWAPTHKKTEPWRFRVLNGQTKNDLGDFLARKYKELGIIPAAAMGSLLSGIVGFYFSSFDSVNAVIQHPLFMIYI